MALVTKDSDTRLERLIEERLREAGAALVGFAGLERLPPEARHGCPRAVSIAVALDPAVVAGIASGPTPAYHAEYRRANALLGHLARLAAGLLRERGFDARACEPTTEEYDRATLSSALPHKTAATLAGLGWIGKCALLVTRDFGAAVRLTTVLTGAPLEAGAPVGESSCGECAACVAACPAGAPSGRPWSAGMPRGEFFDAFACERNAKAMSGARGIAATICGICVASCPWTRRFLARACAPGEAG